MALEEEEDTINRLLADGSIYQTDPQVAQRISFRLGEFDDELLLLLERWEVLEAGGKS